MDYQSPEALNPHDVAWIDADEEDEEDEEIITVKAVSRQVQQPKQGQADMDTAFGVRNIQASLLCFL